MLGGVSQGVMGEEAGGMLVRSALFSLGQYLPFKKLRVSGKNSWVGFLGVQWEVGHGWSPRTLSAFTFLVSSRCSIKVYWTNELWTSFIFSCCPNFAHPCKWLCSWHSPAGSMKWPRLPASIHFPLHWTNCFRASQRRPCPFSHVRFFSFQLDCEPWDVRIIFHVNQYICHYLAHLAHCIYTTKILNFPIWWMDLSGFQPQRGFSNFLPLPRRSRTI